MKSKSVITTLSAEVCKMINFDNLIILSDINGVYNKDPRKHPDAEMIPLIDRLEILDAIDAGDAGSTVGTGGMQTKFKAARIIASTSKTMFIINSGQKDVLNRMFSGESFGTFFDFRNL